MSDGMYMNFGNAESTYGPADSPAVERLNQMMRLRQAERAAAINAAIAARYQQMNAPAAGQRGDMPWWTRPSRVPGEGSLPVMIQAAYEEMAKPQEFKDIVQSAEEAKSMEDLLGQRNPDWYLMEQIMNILSPTGMRRDPALLPQPSRTNMYGRFPGRE